MHCSRATSLSLCLGLFACGRIADGDELADGSEGETGESTSASTGESGDGESSDSDTLDTDASDTESADSGTETSDAETEGTDTEGGGCGLDEIQCPDGTCVWEFDEFPCCSHGGGCAVGCEPQDADKGMGVCPGDAEYAWTGEACEEVCPCQGSDCAEVHASPIECLESYNGSCGFFDFSQCPFDQPVAAISIAGSVPGESVELDAGAFGVFHGKGGGDQIMLRFAADDLTIANYVFNQWTDAYVVGVLQIWAESMVGPQEVFLQWGPGFDPMTMGTLTITGFDIEAADPLDNFVTGTLEVSSDGWDLSGSFGLRHCYPLDQFAP